MICRFLVLKRLSLQTFINAVDLQESLRETRAHSHKVGFVPTMGALHEGHMSLFKEAKRHCDYVAASIFSES